MNALFLDDYNFTIRKDNIEKAKNCLWTLCIKNGWINNDWRFSMEAGGFDFEDLMGYFGLDIDGDPNTGDIISITTYDCFPKHSCEIFSTLAPYIEDGSYLEVRNDEEAKWRWLFNGKKMIEDFCEPVYSDTTKFVIQKLTVMPNDDFVANDVLDVVFSYKAAKKRLDDEIKKFKTESFYLDAVADGLCDEDAVDAHEGEENYEDKYPYRERSRDAEYSVYSGVGYNEKRVTLSIVSVHTERKDLK